MRSRLVNTYESFSSSLMSRFRSQFDEMRLFESFLSCFQMINRSQFDEMRSFESSHQEHIRCLTNWKRAYVICLFETKQSKHWRWNDQTKSRNKSSQTIFVWKNLYRISRITSHTIENESSQKIFARKNLYCIFQITFHIEIRRKTCYQTYFDNNLFHQYLSQ